VVSCTAIEAQIVFKTLLALVASLLVNLPLLASLEERSTRRVLGCFLGAENGDGLEEGFLVDEAAGDGFALLWEAVTEPEVEALPCFQK